MASIRVVGDVAGDAVPFGIIGPSWTTRGVVSDPKGSLLTFSAVAASAGLCVSSLVGVGPGVARTTGGAAVRADQRKDVEEVPFLVIDGLAGLSLAPSGILVGGVADGAVLISSPVSFGMAAFKATLF